MSGWMRRGPVDIKHYKRVGGKNTAREDFMRLRPKDINTNEVGLNKLAPRLFFFMLSSAECEIYPANKSQITTTIENSFMLNIAEHENFSANK